MQDQIKRIPNFSIEFDIEKELEEVDDNNDGFDDDEENGA